MKIIAIAAVTAGGKTTVVNAVKKRLPKAASLHFDDYKFDGEVDDFYKWLSEGADVNVWDLSPLKEDIESISQSGKYDFLLLDYPFAYQHDLITNYINCCIFIDTPLDIAMARRILRDMKNAAAEDILNEMDSYLKFARNSYVKMQKDHLSISDHVIDGAKKLEEIVDETVQIILNC